jgi:hypothetical protein
MAYEFRPGDQVIYKGEVFEVLEKRMGLNFYKIGKKVRSHGQQFLTNIHDGLYADDLKLVTDATVENAMDIEREMKATRGEED